jgi:hypothetical protein
MHICNNERPDTNYSTTTAAPDCYDIYNAAIIKLYLLCLYAKGVKKEYHKPMPMKGKEELTLVLPSCSTCGATLDLKLLRSFGSRRIISDDGNHIIVIIHFVLLMRRSESADCYPFQGITTTTTTTTTICSRVADREREKDKQ